MGMVKAVVSLIVAALLPITSHAVNVVDTVFGVTTRTRVFIYNPQDTGRTLVRAYDLPTDTNYYRYRTVTNGVCTDRG